MVYMPMHQTLLIWHSTHIWKTQSKSELYDPSFCSNQWQNIYSPRPIMAYLLWQSRANLHNVNAIQCNYVCVMSNYHISWKSKKIFVKCTYTRKWSKGQKESLIWHFTNHKAHVEIKIIFDIFNWDISEIDVFCICFSEISQLNMSNMIFVSTCALWLVKCHIKLSFWPFDHLRV